MQFSPYRLRLWLQAIREAYMSLLPLTVWGALAAMVAQNPYPPYIDWMTAHFGIGWQPGAMLVFHATLGVMGLLGAMSIAARLNALRQMRDRRSDLSSITVASVAATGFLMAVLGDRPSFDRLGYASAFQSILVGVASAELMRWWSRRLPHRVKMGGITSGVSLQNALHLTGIAALSLLSMGAAYGALHWLGGRLVVQFMQTLWPWWQQHPPGGDALNLGMVLLNQLLWTVGINGGQFLSLVAVDSPWVAPAATLYSDTMAAPTFLYAFAHLGGAGATWGLILYCITRGKDVDLRRLAWYSVLPAVLNVNELLLFGIPLVLSRVLLLPFILAPVLNCFLAICAVHFLGLALDGHPIAWSTPVLVSGYVVTGAWTGVAVQVVLLVCSTLLYGPFIRRLETQREQHNKDIFKSALGTLLAPEGDLQFGTLQRTDPVGEVARCLVSDFRADLGSARVSLAYQPQHDRHGRVVGLEALLRWTHATHGPIPTGAIIHLAEECELIHDIGAWVVQRACRDTARWRAAGYRDFKVSINMSPVQLDAPQSVQVVRDAMRAHGVGSQDLDIEITEGRSLTSSPQAEKTMAELEAMGIPLSMDDFGMGCTSLVYMHRFKMYALKLDGVLTRHVLHNPVDQEIIRCVSRLGHSQGVHVVAEFVETADQQAMLQELGCDFFQGWLYSPAMPAEHIPAYLEKSHRAAAVAVPA